jgi:L-threonylcarbamoyladenylate synthase
MVTKQRKLTKKVSAKTIQEAVCVIKGGGIVAFPTETYYGLAVDPFNEKSLNRLFEVKKRPFEKAILNLIDTQEKLFLFTENVEDAFLPLMARFWPGPLTLVVKAKAGISPMLACDNGTVGVRISSHPVAQTLCREMGQPITATSANLSGQKAAETAQEVAWQLGAGVDLIIDGGRTPGGKGSTIVGIENNKLKLIRDGVVDFAMLKDLV